MFKMKIWPAMGSRIAIFSCAGVNWMEI